MTTSARDPYEVLGLPAGTTGPDVRRAFRRLALQWHPDRNPGNSEALARFKELLEAYNKLTDGLKQREREGGWRSWLKVLRPGGEAEAAVAPPSKEVPPASDSFIEALIGSGRRAAARPGKTPSGIHRRPAAANPNGQAPASAPRPQPAMQPSPQLGGHTIGQPSPTTQTARGTNDPTPQLEGDPPPIVPVPFERAALGGMITGLTINLRWSLPGRPAVWCRHATRVAVPAAMDGERRVRIQVVAPPRAWLDSGTPVALDVLPEPVAGQLTREVTIVLQPQPHPAWRLEGRDVHGRMTINLAQAIYGDRVPYQTLHGQVAIRIPPNTQPGKRIRLKGYGVPGPNAPDDGQEKGDHYLQIDVALPEFVTQRDKKSFHTLAKNLKLLAAMNDPPPAPTAAPRGKKGTAAADSPEKSTN